MHNKAWASGTVKDGSLSNVILTWIFALVWNGLAFGITFAVAMKQKAGTPDKYIILAFPAVGVLILLLAIYVTVRYLKFGRSRLELETLPGCIGGWLAGTIHTRAPLRDAEMIRLTLRCIRREERGSGKNRRRWDRTIWEEEQVLAPSLPTGREGGIEIPVAFRIPSDCSPTFDSPRDDILWQLLVRAPMPGADYAADFAVPVFAVRQPPRFVPRAEAQAAKVRASRAAVAALEDPLIDISTNVAGRKRLAFPARRNHGLARGLTLAAAICFGVGGVASAMGAPFIFPLFFGLFGLLLGSGAVIYWFRHVEVLVDRQGIERNWRLLGFSGSERIAAGDIVELKRKVTAEANGTPYHSLMAERPDGKEMKLVSNLRTSDATHVLEEITRALGR